MTVLQDGAVSLSSQREANLLSLRLRTRCSTNYSDSDINENPHVYFQRTNQRLASICLIWSLIKMCFMNSKCELSHNKEAPEKNKNWLIGKPTWTTRFPPQKQSRTKWQAAGNDTRTKKGLCLITRVRDELTPGPKPLARTMVKSNFYRKSTSLTLRQWRKMLGECFRGKTSAL